VQLAHLRGIGFDLPAAREAYEDDVRSFGLEHAGCPPPKTAPTRNTPANRHTVTPSLPRDRAAPEQATEEDDLQVFQAL
jgi:hypothetical protein